MKTFFVSLSLLLATMLSSCQVVPSQGRYGQPMPMMMGQQGHPGFNQQMGPMVPNGQMMTGNRQTTEWRAGPVLHERWKYDSATGKTIKVSEEEVSPQAASSAMQAQGLTPFPDRIPVGGEMPSFMRGPQRDGPLPSP